MQIVSEMGLRLSIFDGVKPNPTVSVIRAGVRQMQQFLPDVVIAIGGGSAMDAAKTMRLLYEHPELDIHQMESRFLDIRKKIVEYPRTGSQVKSLICIPTTSGSGAEVTPFVVVTEDETHRKYPIADYALTPDMAIIDPDFVMTMPSKLTAHTGLDALSHAIESYVSVMSTHYTKPIALQAIKLIFRHSGDDIL
jgi:acetaldehyde dehydrogenase/alcohol dehydrogenase